MLAVKRSDDVRNENRKRVLTALRRSGVASRTEIGKTTNLSASTVSAITSDFLEEGILVPPKISDTANIGRGRPKVDLTINPTAAIVCAVYFQLNGVSAAIFDYAGAEISKCVIDVSMVEATPARIKETMIDCINQAFQKSGHDSSSLCRIAVGFQGVTDVAGSCVLWTPICSHCDIPVQEWLEKYFRVPTRVSNDCDMIARALNWRKPEKYGDNFAAVLLAHGVGMGLYLRNDIMNGIRSSGIEFGHMTYIPNGALCRCGKSGCIEAYAGDYAISRRAQGQSGHASPVHLLDRPDLESIMIAARVGDADATEAIEAAGAAIGTGLASLFALVDPFPVVLVGRGAILFNQMEKSIRASLEFAPGYKPENAIDFECFSDENSLVIEGCATTALLAQDEEMSSKRLNLNEARTVRQQEGSQLCD